MENQVYKITSIIANQNNTSIAGTILDNPFNISAYCRGSGRNLWNIHSVKRLSDNVVFTVGDTISNRYWKYSDDRDVIIKISIDIDRIHYDPSGLFIQTAKGWSAYLESISVEEEFKLFTSEDNIEVLSTYNKTIYLIKDNKILTINTNLRANYAVHKDNKECKWFVNELHAREYLIFNTPCLSIMDLISESKNKLPIFNLSNKKRKEIADSLYNIVKSKI